MTVFTILDEIPSPASTFYIPSGVGEKGLIVKFHGREEWVGVFAAVRLAKNGFSDVVRLGSQSVDLLVLSGGEGYVVDPNIAGQFRQLGVSPVIWAKFFVSLDLLVLVTPWEIRALREQVVLWDTGRISVDGINIESSTDTVLRGSVDTLEGQEKFVLEVADGKLRGVCPLPFN